MECAKCYLNTTPFGLNSCHKADCLTTHSCDKRLFPGKFYLDLFHIDIINVFIIIYQLNCNCVKSYQILTGMKGIIKDNRRLSEGDGMSLERESFEIIQNQSNQTFDVPDKPSSARFYHLKDIKSEKLANHDWNNSFEGFSNLV